MKKFFMIALVFIITTVSCVNCFAYINYDFLMDYASASRLGYPEWAFSDDSQNQYLRDTYNVEINGCDFSNYIYTNEYKYVDGTAMVKLRDMVGRIGGKVDYNKNSKTTKVYFNWERDKNNCIKSFSVTPGYNVISASYYTDSAFCGWKSSGSFRTSTSPRIINGSLYISAVDLGKALAPFWNTTYGGYFNTTRQYADVKDGVLYICADAVKP